MTEPITVGSILGLKYTTMLGGFLGALVSLSFLTELGWGGRVSAVLTGTVTSAYATPVIVSWWAAGAAAEGSVGFFIGLTSMNIVPAVMAGSKWVRSNIQRILSRKFDLDEDKDK